MTDKEYLSLAISIGFLNIDKFRNKHVGCIIVKDDRIISVGFRTMFPKYHGYEYACVHSEVLALKSIESIDVNNCTLYSTMCPCSFRILDERLYPFEPCSQYIIKSGKVSRVVVAQMDTWVGHGGEKILTDAGIEVIHIPISVPATVEVVPEEFRELIEPFLEKKNV